MAEPSNDRFWPVARDKLGLLRAMMQALAGASHISFEGDLSRMSFPQALGPSEDETDALKRNTLSPMQDFVVLPMPPKSLQSILDVVIPNARFINDVLHIQIERNGQLQFGSYDQFHPECIVCYPPGVSVELLEQLRISGVIRAWSVPKEGARRWHG